MSHFLDNLPNNLKVIAYKANLNSPRDVILTSDLKFLNFGARAEDIRLLKLAAAKHVTECFTSVRSLLQNNTLSWSRLSFGCNSLDKCTGGGIMTRGITEICGEAGAGKTQILLQLCLTVQHPIEHGGLGRSVAFISTENVFPSKRICQIADSFTNKFGKFKINYLSNIFIENLTESEDLLNCVSVRLPKLVVAQNIGLIIIDSVAAVFRTNSNIIGRAKEMRTLANDLLKIGHKFNCAIVCINQVATVDSASPSVPCLGLTWAHLGRTRFKVSKVPKQVQIENRLNSVRKLEVIYSPESPHDYGEFLITSEGVCEFHDTRTINQPIKFLFTK